MVFINECRRESRHAKHWTHLYRVYQSENPRRGNVMISHHKSQQSCLGQCYCNTSKCLPAKWSWQIWGYEWNLEIKKILTDILPPIINSLQARVYRARVAMRIIFPLLVIMSTVYVTTVVVIVWRWMGFPISTIYWLFHLLHSIKYMTLLVWHVVRCLSVPVTVCVKCPFVLLHRGQTSEAVFRFNS